VFFHWKTLNRRFGICARHKSLSHDFWEINDMRDLIPFSLVFESSTNRLWINEWREYNLDGSLKL
jgi:hypothetical protein